MKKFKKLILSKNEKLILTINAIYALSGIFINSFIVAKLIILTNDYLKTVCIYFLIIFGLRTIGGPIIGAYIKSFPERKHKALNLGLLIRALYVIAIIILGDNMIKYYSILAVIYAISECCYHFANDAISIEVTNLDNRSSYIALKTFISNTIQLLLPITFGTSITLYSFTNIGIYISIFCLIGCIFCFFIQLDEEDNFYDYENEENNRKEDFTPITFIKRVNGDKLTLIKDFFVSAMFYGLFEKVFQLLFIYVIMLNYNSLISLGVILTIMAFFSLIVGYFYHKCGNKHSKTILIICCILVFIAALSLMYNINSKIAAIIFGLCFYGANTIFGSMYSTCKGNVSNNYKLRTFFCEYMAYQTIYQNIGRTISIILLLLASISGIELLFRLELIIMGFFGVVSAISMHLIIKEIGSNKY